MKGDREVCDSCIADISDETKCELGGKLTRYCSYTSNELDTFLNSVAKSFLQHSNNVIVTMTTVRIQDDTAHAINELGGTFDSPNDVIQQLIVDAGHEELLEDAREPVPEAETEEPEPVPETEAVAEAYVVKLYDNGEQLERFEETGHGSQGTIMATVANYLIRNRNLIDRITSLPYVPRGKKALINDSPTRTDGNRMRAYEDLVEGYYIDTHYDASSKIERINDLAQKCGLNAEFNGDW